MTLAQIDFRCESGADWQRQIRLRADAESYVSLDLAVMEIRNANFQLALRLDEINGHCQVVNDGLGSIIALHIPAQVSADAFSHGNFPGQYQAIGFWGIGRAYLYDLFVHYAYGGVQDRILKGFFYVDPNVTQFPPIPVGAPA